MNLKEMKRLYGNPGSLKFNKFLLRLTIEISVIIYDTFNLKRI